MMIDSCEMGKETHIWTERVWDPERKKCIHKNQYEEHLVCGCPTATENTLCVEGAMETRVGI